MGKQVIHLDTCWLIATTDIGSESARLLRTRIAAGQHFTASSIAWSEFLNGPVTENQCALISAIIGMTSVEFTHAAAEEAARLFNLAGRRRTSHPDCMIAATAMLSGCPLATLNDKDFIRFVPFGLRLEKIA